MVREVEDEDTVEPPGEASMLEEEENRPRSRRGTWVSEPTDSRAGVDVGWRASAFKTTFFCSSSRYLRILPDVC